MQGHDVTQLKNILIDKGNLSGDLIKGDSIFDEEVEKAVINFQKAIGIDADDFWSNIHIGSCFI